MNKIQRYFNSLAKQIAIQAEVAGISTHRPDIGTNRETIVQLFLNKHLPRRLNASIGGQIIGCDGKESGQIDIIVSSDIAVRFEENERTFVTAESVGAAISVKSYLDKAAVEDSLLNLASIPQISPAVLEVNFANNGFDKFIKSHPSLYIFAYDGIQLETCLGHVQNFYATHPDIPLNRYPKGIFVNCQYMITFQQNVNKTLAGVIIPSRTFYGASLDKTIIGYPLISLINDVCQYTTWLPVLTITFSSYFTNGSGLPVDLV
ncbi:MAG: hypothetical protein JWQ98_1888 [Chlorobi bacterium]|nr:hypothetical protein [Chlorobiota bacterium]